MSSLFPHPLPWYIAGPIIGLMVPTLFLLGNKSFGVSSDFRHLCAAMAPCNQGLRTRLETARGWNIAFLAGIFAEPSSRPWLPHHRS